MKYIMRGMKETLIVGLAMVAALALMLPSFIPDFLPFVGKVDEAFWTLILINTASYYGINMSSLYGDNKKRVIRRKVKKKPSAPSVYVEKEASATGKKMVIHDGSSETPVIEEK